MEFEVSPRGWVVWPDREDLSIEFTRVLAAAQEGGSAVAECLLTMSRIDFSDDVSWYREWKRIADITHERGDAALRDGNIQTAKSNWLRAVNYYQAAAFPLDRADGDQQSAIESMRRCAVDYLRHRNPAGEVVSIPWPSNYPLQGYFLAAGSGSDRAPAVICIGEPGHRKEEYLYKMARHASDRGMSLLAVDLLGAGSGEAFDEVVGGSDLETAIAHIMDYLAARDDVDERRIAILADEWSSSFVARGIAFDDRFAAAVCDGGIWDLHERAFLTNRLGRPDARPAVSRAARNIKCPVLIAAGERGWLKAGRVRELYEGLRGDGRDVTLKIFASEETAAMHGHLDNPTLANEFIFDWIASRLEYSARDNVFQRSGPRFA
jgi:dienelactone hydrolase